MLFAAAATSHLGLFSGVLVAGFAIGIIGHLMRSRLLVIAGIAVIACVSLYVVASGEIQTFPS